MDNNTKPNNPDWRNRQRGRTDQFEEPEIDTTSTDSRTDNRKTGFNHNKNNGMNHNAPNDNVEHMGMRFLRERNVAMIFTFAAILTQAWMFGMLGHREFHAQKINSPMWLHLIMAVIFEFTGILIGASFNNRKIGGDDGISIRAIWLSIFFGIQVLGDLCLLEVIPNRTISTTLIAVSMPIAILAYANLYIAENLKKLF